MPTMPPRHSVRFLLSTLGVLAAVGCMLVPTAAAGDGSDAQAGYDQQYQGSVGGWGNTTVGVAGRPYIKRLAVDGTVVIDNTGDVPAPTSQAGQTLTATVAGYNICGPGQSPGPGSCYADPNRVNIALQRYTGTGWTTDFTGNPTTVPQVTESSVIDITVGIRPALSSLGWSWLNGTPSYWKSAVDANGGTVQVKFSMSSMPDLSGQSADFCTAIPVSSCNVVRATSEVLRTEWLLSFDTTLDAAFRGALFASNRAIIGSLDAVPGSATQPAVLTYGLAAPHELADGQLRVGAFYALLPAAVLPSFGTTMAAFDASIMSVQRVADTSGALPAQVTWTPWSEGTNGSEGQFLTVSNISFSAPKFQVTRTSTAQQTNQQGAKGLSIRRGERATFGRIAKSIGLRTKGRKLSAKVSTPRICRVVRGAIVGTKAGTCRGTLTARPKPGKGKVQKKGFTVVIT